ncbi:unnamed protein product [Cutaneotrichosporon oleaginosum]
MPSSFLESHTSICDAIIQNAPHASLVALRATSRTMRDVIDRHLVKHVGIRHSASIVLAKLPEGYRRIPRADWLNVSNLTDAVRVVDIVVTEEDEEAARKHNAEHREALKEIQRKLQNGTWGGRRPALGAPRCWCNQDTVEVSGYNHYLSLRLKNVKLIRRWRGHRCRQLIKAPRTITFIPPNLVNPAHVFLQGDAETSEVHVVHLGHSSQLTIEHHTFPQDVAHVVVRIAPPSSDPARSAAPFLSVHDCHRATLYPLSDFAEAVACRVAVDTVKITLVGSELWSWLALEPKCFGLQAVHWIYRHLVGALRVSRKDAMLISMNQVMIMTESEYKLEMGWMYDLEAYCEQSGL